MNGACASRWTRADGRTNCRSLCQNFTLTRHTTLWQHGAAYIFEWHFSWWADVYWMVNCHGEIHGVQAEMGWLTLIWFRWKISISPCWVHPWSMPKKIWLPGMLKSNQVKLPREKETCELLCKADGPDLLSAEEMTVLEHSLSSLNNTARVMIKTPIKQALSKWTNSVKPLQSRKNGHQYVRLCGSFSW